MAWSTCKSKFQKPKLDEAYVARRLGIPQDQVSPRLHKLKKSLGIRGQSVLICLDDGAVYLNQDDVHPIGSLLDQE